MSREPTQRLHADLGKLRGLKPPELGLRFAFGAAISVAAGLVALRFGQRFGGLFLAFPAILPASLTLIERKEGNAEASIDSVGAAFGGAALLPFALFALWLLPRWPPALALGAATAAWLAVSAGLYAAAQLWLRRHRLAPSPPDEERHQDPDGGNRRAKTA